jgi:hypothetical protein
MVDLDQFVFLDPVPPPREIVEKILKMHSVDCSKCYEDAQKRLELQAL